MTVTVYTIVQTTHGYPRREAPGTTGRTAATLTVALVDGRMGRGEIDVTVFQVLADEYSRRILLAADREPRTAKDLSDICDASLTTIYRRVSTLQEYDLIREHSTVGADGAHRSQFETTLEELHVAVSDGELSLSVETRDELADNFTSLWTNMREDR